MSLPDSVMMEGNRSMEFLDELFHDVKTEPGGEMEGGGDTPPPKETKSDTNDNDKEDDGAPEPEYELTISGKKRKLPLSKILRQAEQVGGLTDQMHELKELAEIGRQALESKRDAEQKPTSFSDTLGSDNQLSPFGGSGYDQAALSRVARAIDALNEKTAYLEDAGSHLFGERMVNTLSSFVKEHPIVDKESDSCNEEVMGAFIQQLEDFGVRKAFRSPNPETAKRLAKVLDLAYRAAAFEHQATIGKKDLAEKISRREKELAAGGPSNTQTPGGKTTNKPKRLGQGFRAAGEDVLEELGFITPQ